MQVRHELKLILLTSVLGLSGCAATPEVRTVYQTKEVFIDRYVSVPERLTRAVEVPMLSPEFDVYELGAVAKAREIRLLQCNGQLQEISQLD